MLVVGNQEPLLQNRLSGTNYAIGRYESIASGFRRWRCLGGAWETVLTAAWGRKFKLHSMMLPRNASRSARANTGVAWPQKPWDDVRADSWECARVAF